MKLSKILLGVSLVSLLASPVFAHGMGGMGGGPFGGPDKLFEKVDLNKDGVITKDELKAAHAAMFDKIDTNKDGFITKEEMQAFHEQQRKEFGDRGPIADLDTNKDGKVSKAEWDAIKSKLPPEMAARHDAVFKEIDTNNDGYLTKEEFEAHRAKMVEHGHDGMMGERHHGPDGMMMGAGGPPMDGKASQGQPPKDGKAPNGTPPQGQPPQGQPPQGQPPMGHDGKMGRVDPDTNHDGKISREEWMAMPLPPIFEMADANHDGKITKQEAADAFKKMQEMRREHRMENAPNQGTPNVDKKPVADKKEGGIKGFFTKSGK